MVSNMTKLGNALSKRMQDSIKGNREVIHELGVVNGDLSITVDSLPEPIAKSDYMIDIRLTHDTYYTFNELNSSQGKPHIHQGAESAHKQATGDGIHIHNSDGLHTHRIPSVFRGLKSGDRVLVEWVSGEPIVVTIVVPGDQQNKNEGTGAE